jgi:hypothetical protein
MSKCKFPKEKPGKTAGFGPTASGWTLAGKHAVRLLRMDFYERCRNVARSCHAFGISRQTFNHWQRRYDPYEPTRLV